LGYFFPRVLVPLWRAWMKLAHYMGLVMTFVILSVAWTIGFVPMAYLLKILRIKSMDLRYGANTDSYWEKRDTKYDDFKRLELQY
jgi:general stress protein CsbA